MKPLDSKILKKFLTLASDQLTGNWILIGGTLLPALGLDVRSTMDIDFVAEDTESTNQTLLLMGIAEQLKLPVETINQTGAYFLKKIPDYKERLILMKQGKQASIFRPELDLYIELKANRLTETDLQDCFSYLKFCKKKKEKFDSKKTISFLKKRIRSEKNIEKTNRLKALLDQIETLKT